MPDNKKEKVIEIKPTPSSIQPLSSNVVAISPQDDVVVLDFGFLSRSYVRPYKLEDEQVARICLSWDSVEFLHKRLGSSLSERKKEFKNSTPKTK